MLGMKKYGLPLVLVLTTALGCAKPEKAEPTEQKAPSSPDSEVAAKPSLTSDRVAKIDLDQNLDPDSPETVEISFAPIEVGFTYSIAETAFMTTEFQAKGTRLTISGTTTKNKTIEVLTVKEEFPTKAKAYYKEFSSVKMVNSVEKITDNSIANTNYIVERVDDETVFKGEAGDDVSGDEATLLAKDLKHFGRLGKWQRALKDKTFRVGQRQALADFAPLLGDLEGLRGAPKVGITLKGFRDSLAVFAIDATLTLEDKSTIIDAVFIGAFTVDPATGRSHKMQMTNKLTFSGEMTGTGTTTGSKTWTYR